MKHKSIPPQIIPIFLFGSEEFPKSSDVFFEICLQEFPDRYGFRQGSNHDGIIPSCWKWMHHCQKIKALLGRDFLKLDSRFCASLHTIRQISTQKPCSMEYGVRMYTRLVGSICHQKSKDRAASRAWPLVVCLGSANAIPLAFFLQDRSKIHPTEKKTNNSWPLSTFIKFGVPSLN